MGLGKGSRCSAGREGRKDTSGGEQRTRGRRQLGVLQEWNRRRDGVSRGRREVGEISKDKVA